MICRWCHRKYKKPIVDGKVTSCPHKDCGGCFPEGYQQEVIDIPDKRDARYYKEGWFRRSDKEWMSNIHNRKYQQDGSVQHVNDRGETIFVSGAK